MPAYKKPRWIRTTRGATPHNICFDCRVSFKDISVCPHCQKSLINAGTRFKPPRRNNLHDWKRLELIYLSGSKYRHWDAASTVRDAKQLLEDAWQDNPTDKSSQQTPPTGLAKSKSYRVCYRCRLTFRHIRTCPECHQPLVPVEFKFTFKKRKSIWE